MTAVALALSADAGLAARQLVATAALIDALPDGELVTVWILTLAPRPILVSDAQRLRPYGRRHIERRLSSVLDALSAAKAAMRLRKERDNAPDSNANGRGEEDGNANSLAPLVSAMASHVLSTEDGSVRQTRLWQGAALEVLNEMSTVDAHAEGTVSRNLVVVSPRSFGLVEAAVASSSSSIPGAKIKKKKRAKEKSKWGGLFGGGRWALSWFTAQPADREPRVYLKDGSMALEVGWGGSIHGSVLNMAANTLTDQFAARRQRIYRGGLCGLAGAITTGEGISAWIMSASHLPLASSSLNATAPVSAVNNMNDDVGGDNGGSQATSCTKRHKGDRVFIDITHITHALTPSSSYVRCLVPLPPNTETEHLASATCDANAAAKDDFPYPAGDSLILRMTPAQRSIFDSKRAFLRGSWEEMVEAKKDMRLSVILGNGGGLEGGDDRFGVAASETSGPGIVSPIPATASFRGVSSFRDCVRRKSLKVNLKGSARRRLAPGSASAGCTMPGPG